MKPRTNLFLLSTTLLCAVCTAQHFARNNIITYQGHIRSEGSDFTGTGQFKFALITSSNQNHTATATATVSGGFVTIINITDGGSGYLSVPAVSLVEGGGSGATTTASISGGSVTDVAVTGNGSGYTSAPTVLIEPPPENLAFTTYWSNDGSSVDGSEPANGVTVAIEDGLFTVPLGDTTLPNMTSLSEGVFQEPGLELRIWFDDGVNGFSVLSPTQHLTATPYSFMAGSASNLLGALPAGQLSGSIPSASLSGSYENPVSFSDAANAFTGDGSGLTGLNASALVSGTIPDARLSSNVARTGGVWLLDGNLGTAPGAHFLGTTDDVPLELKVNNQSALRLLPETFSPVLIAGHASNSVSSTSPGSSIAGGGDYTYPNTIGGASRFGTISGGADNVIGSNARQATIGGGGGNEIGSNSFFGTVGGGYANSIDPDAMSASISGGYNSTARGAGSAVGGGGIAQHSPGSTTYFPNIASGVGSTIPSGAGNRAAGRLSLAAGYNARAEHDGSFVWADTQLASFSSTASNQFLVRASGGVGINTNDPASALHVAGEITTDSLRVAEDIATDNLDVAEGITADNLAFPQAFGQKATLYNDDFGIGVQAFTTYFRSESRFAWFVKGQHADGAYDPGAGGTVRMTLDSVGLAVNGTFVSSSDENQKQEFAEISPATVLEKVISLPLSSWSYKADPESSHFGPMAQDFYDAFGLGPDDKHIATVDADGVALAAIQGLNEKVEGRMKNAETGLQALRLENAELKRELAELKRLDKTMRQKLKGNAQ